jgi:small subunit ribosomal protein S5
MQNDNIQTTTPVQPQQSQQPQNRGGGGRGRDGKKRERNERGRPERPRAEFEQKIISLRRVTRVVAGGRRFSFSVALVAGDKKGRVGVGLGKAGDTSLAIDKALRDAKKHMIKIPLTKTGSIPHEVEAKYSSARLVMKPAPGRGIVAGSAIRGVLELGGVKDVMAKLISPSKNQLNMAQASVLALNSFKNLKK